ncbi:MAG: hypothetical protein IT495_17000 [Gammaproteobacteria bacterium]|nr:hypothetical protein [Gammaproteobacteria bacterium]
MFCIDVSPTYRWPVTVELMTTDGEMQRHEFQAEFVRLSTTEIEALQRQAAAGELEDAALIDQVLRGWADVADEHGEPLAVNAANRERLLDVHPVRACLVRAWFESLEGARRKNS